MTNTVGGQVLVREWHRPTTGHHGSLTAHKLKSPSLPLDLRVWRHNLEVVLKDIVSPPKFLAISYRGPQSPLISIQGLTYVSQSKKPPPGPHSEPLFEAMDIAAQWHTGLDVDLL